MTVVRPKREARRRTHFGDGIRQCGFECCRESVRVLLEWAALALGVHGRGLEQQAHVLDRILAERGRAVRERHKQPWCDFGWRRIHKQRAQAQIGGLANHLDGDGGLLEHRGHEVDAKGFEALAHFLGRSAERRARVAHERRAQLGQLSDECVLHRLQVTCEGVKVARAAEDERVEAAQRGRAHRPIVGVLELLVDRRHLDAELSIRVDGHGRHLLYLYERFRSRGAEGAGGRAARAAAGHRAAR